MTTQKLKIEKKMGWQEFTVELPSNHGLSRFKFLITKTYPGNTYKDTYLSDIQILVKNKVPYNPKVEEAKKLALKKWIIKRLEAAKFFASQPTNYPFSSTKFNFSNGKDYFPVSYKEEYKGASYAFYNGNKPQDFPYQKELAEAEAYASKYQQRPAGKDVPWRRLVHTNKLHFLPDSLYFKQPIEDMIKPYISYHQLTFFETSKELAQELKGESEFSSSTTNHIIKDEADGLKVISYWYQETGIKRGPYTSTVAYSLGYKNELLQWVLAKQNQIGLTFIKFTYNQDKKISEMLKVKANPGFEEEGSTGDSPYGYEIYKAQAL